MIFLKSLLCEAADVRATIRAQGWDKGKVRRFVILLLKDIEKQYSGQLKLQSPVSITTPHPNSSEYFCIIQFTVNDVTNLDEIKSTISSIHDKWEKTFKNDIDSYVDFTRFF